MAARVGLVLTDVEFNDVNGGSFSVIARKAKGRETPDGQIARILAEEAEAGLHTLTPYRAFEERIQASREELRAFVAKARAGGKVVAALGASTKGNVLLQYCGFTADDICAVGEVNPDKFGCFTPGSWIPIVPEAELMDRKPDYLLVLPWHFRKFFEQSGAYAGAQLVFPLPELSIPSG
jgi:NDP-4-keto-2,6-dideoxyhexose 3-C-methyltransferase